MRRGKKGRRKERKRDKKRDFLFQAEDGIRDLVRSRGLGEVYKGQASISGAGRQRRAGSIAYYFASYKYAACTARRAAAAVL